MSSTVLSPRHAAPASEPGQLVAQLATSGRAILSMDIGFPMDLYLWPCFHSHDIPCMSFESAEILAVAHVLCKFSGALRDF